MTAQEKLDYVFRQMDDATRALADRAMDADPELAAQVARLGGSIALMIDDGEEYAPPPSLASRTIAMVERRKSHPQVQDLMPARAPFRMADFAVAATVFFAAVFTLSIPILRSRAQMSQAACAFNLGRLGISLASYRDAHGEYPLVPPDYLAGTYGVMLKHSGNLPDPTVLLCPCSPKSQLPAAMPSFDQYEEMVEKSPAACREMLEGHFAYNVGYRDPRDHEALKPAATGSNLPIASDVPPFSPDGTILEGNSPSHGGRGQNVGFGDGHVAFRTTRWISRRDRDLYLNENRRRGPGLHADDSSLTPSVLPAVRR